MIRQMKTRERGYSLAEVLVATAIFAIIILAALLIYDRSNRVFKQGVESSNMQQNTRVAFEKLAADLRMTGFDFDRDGIPTAGGAGGNQYQQPDEQFEYIGPSAVTIRANFDYETENQPCTATLTENCDNGREGASYESTQFPIVTTGNDEMVTYALVPDNQTPSTACNATTNCVQYYADTNVPRNAYPGGSSESLVQITGVDLCNGGCNNPPYTLYRFTLKRDQTDFTAASGSANIVRTPLASNIRSMQYTYYQDAQGTDPLKDLTNTTDVSTGAAIRGEGRWMQNNPGGLVVNREIRAKVNSLRLVLVGMNEQPDRSYTDAAETVASAVNYRKYRLETLIAPRNIQKRGMREQDTFAPGVPTNVHICTGYCGGIYISWDAPGVSSTVGAPDQYKIIYGPDVAGGGFPCETTVFTNTWAYVFGSSACGPLTPNSTYKFAVVALNSYGSGSAPAITGIVPLNATKPNPPTWVTTPLVPATTTQNGKVTLTWNRPAGNATGTYSCPLGGTNPGVLPSGEVFGYLVERSPDGTTWTPVAPTGTPAVSVISPYDVVTFDDTTVENCVTYYYRVTAIERCAAADAYNTTGTLSTGRSAPSGTVTGGATSNVAPAAPADLTIDQTLTTGPTGNCNGLGQCRPNLMTWPKVMTDVNSAPITVLHYNVYRRDLPSTTWALEQAIDYSSGTPLPPGPTITYLGQMVNTGSGQQYEYRVTAQQCTPPAGESAPSPARLWPCTLLPGTIVTTPPLSASGAFDGTGSAGTPWLFNDTAAVIASVNAATTNRVAWRVYTQAGNLKWQEIDTAAPYAVQWTIDPNMMESVTATIVDTAGCATQYQAWVEDEPQGCCLENFTNDPTVVAFSSGNLFVDVFLKNICSNALPLTSISLTWDPTKAPNNTKVASVVFPTSTGTTTVSVNSSSSAVTVTAPVGTTAIPITGGTAYRIRINFSTTGQNTLSQNPLTGFTANYNNPGASPTAQSCAIE